jgi:DNA-binding NtrC family response regulator
VNEDPKSTDTTHEVQSISAPHERGWLRAVVMRDAIVDTFALPESGLVSIGRMRANEICIDHAAVSRRHATLQIGHMVALVDLGSRNGTNLRGDKVPANTPVEVLPGDVIEFGPTMVVLQRMGDLERPRRLLSHGYFEARLEEACAQAGRARSTFALLRIGLERGDPDRVQETLARSIRPADLVARYGPRDYEVMLLETSPEEARRLTEELRASLARLDADARTGLACFPRDGRSPESLMAEACSIVFGADAPQRAGPPVLEDPTMQKLYQLAKRIATSLINVLVLGETGVGKEVLAEHIHRSTNRATRPFLRLNCGALNESLLESGLFGHERGAFTGAVQTKPGLLETADGGTVFLDEIGELPPSVQVKLLRVLEDKQVQRVGGLKPRPIDVRFVAATNRDLETEVAEGRFRADLYYRLNGISLIAPPLRERAADIEPLARAFLTRAAGRTGGATPELPPETISWLKGYSWPGNIRELRNFIDRAALLCGDGPVRPEHLPTEKMGTILPARRPLARAAAESPSSHDACEPMPSAEQPTIEGRDLRTETEDLERRRILEVLEQCGGNQTRAADLLGMPRRTLLRRLEQFRIPRPRKG